MLKLEVYHAERVCSKISVQVEQLDNVQPCIKNVSNSPHFIRIMQSTCLIIHKPLWRLQNKWKYLQVKMWCNLCRHNWWNELTIGVISEQQRQQLETQNFSWSQPDGQKMRLNVLAEHFGEVLLSGVWWCTDWDALYFSALYGPAPYRVAAWFGNAVKGQLTQLELSWWFIFNRGDPAAFDDVFPPRIGVKSYKYPQSGICVIQFPEIPLFSAAWKHLEALQLQQDMMTNSMHNVRLMYKNIAPTWAF